MSNRINSPSTSILLVSILLALAVALEPKDGAVARRGLRSIAGAAGGPPLQVLPTSGTTTLSWMKQQKLVNSAPTKGRWDALR